MATRSIEQKPDPATRKNVMRARSGSRSAKRAQTFVVAASLTTTLMGWALFSHREAQSAATAQLGETDMVVVSLVSVQQTVSPSPTAMPTVVAGASTTQSATPIANSAVVAVTRSSQ